MQQNVRSRLPEAPKVGDALNASVRMQRHQQVVDRRNLVNRCHHGAGKWNADYRAVDVSYLHVNNTDALQSLFRQQSRRDLARSEGQRSQHQHVMAPQTAAATMAELPA